MNKPTPSVVCDAGPLIHLDELDALSLLNDFDPVLVPEQVGQEVSHHRPGVLDDSVLRCQQVGVVIPSDPSFQILAQTLSLDIGEQAALKLMQGHPQAIFLTDDAAARLAAFTLGYRVHGSIGILVRAIRRHQLSRDEVKEILRTIPRRSTLHIRPDLLVDIIKKL